ncbi:MAG TPA: dihydropteroate synthase [Chitinophagaceae bacterium]|nr:dihydropteroate synthase [Chitinophagaceae bacterium]
MFTLNCKGKLLVIERPIVMGIINITPDSFFSASRKQNTGEMLKCAEQMLQDGATILDIGGQSTRPGSVRVSTGEELERVIEPIRSVSNEFPGVFISIDTFSSAVAKEAVQAGAAIINDISAGSMDPGMISTVASLQVPYICMHMKGDPGNMQQDPQYKNVTAEVLDFCIQKKKALQAAGITDIIMDPGFGFGKTAEQNFELLRNLEVFSMLASPLLIGISRKSTIYKTLGVSPEEALNGSTVLHTMALLKGANILRVHDVRPALEAIQLCQAYMAK